MKRDEICMNKFLGRRVPLAAGPSQPSSSRPLCWATLQAQLPQSFGAVPESCLKGDSSRGGRTLLLSFQVPFPKAGWPSRAVLILTHPKMPLTLSAASICQGSPGIPQCSLARLSFRSSFTSPFSISTALNPASLKFYSV